MTVYSTLSQLINSYLNDHPHWPSHRHLYVYSILVEWP